MPARTVELDGIALEVPDPRAYLEALSRAVELVPFYSPDQRKAIAEALGHLPRSEIRINRDAMMRVLGSVDYDLIAVMDREWQDHDGNEADRLFEYASSRGLFASVRSVFLLGAGPCRLADHLASLEFIGQVVCSDLSWPALNFGRALIEANHAELPELLRKPRVFYHVEPQSTRLSRTIKESRLKAPLTPPDRHQRIRYSVRDAFAPPDEPIAADLIVVPYLLDIFRGARCISLLLRICQRVRVGQQIVILVTCIVAGKAGPGRDPGEIVDVLHSCGFKVRFLDLLFLPYSFSYYSYGQMHTNWNTLVVRAERMAERNGDIVIAKSDRWDAFRARQSDKATLPGLASLDRFFSRLQSAANYQVIAAELIPQMGAAGFENFVGELLSRGLIELRLNG